MPTHADAHDAFVDDAGVDHLEGSPVPFGAKRPHFPGRKFVQQKKPALARAERGTRIVFKTGGPVRIVGDGRKNERGLAWEMGLPVAFAHPRAVHFQVLKIAAPAAVARFRQIDKTFPFPFLVGVIVDCEQVTIVVEGGLLRIAHPPHVDLEMRSIRLDPHDGPLVRVKKLASLARGDVQAFVADAPIDASIGSDDRAMHVVTGVGDVNPEAVDDDFADVRDAIIVRIFETPEIRRDGGVFGTEERCFLATLFKPTSAGIHIVCSRISRSPTLRRVVAATYTRPCGSTADATGSGTFRVPDHLCSTSSWPGSRTTFGDGDGAVAAFADPLPRGIKAHPGIERLLGNGGGA